MQFRKKMSKMNSKINNFRQTFRQTINTITKQYVQKQPPKTTINLDRQRRRIIKTENDIEIDCFLSFC